MSKNIEDLREALFAALAEARDTSKDLDIQRARATCEIAARITDTARLEVDFMRVTGNKRGSGFVPIQEDAPALLAAPAAAVSATANGTQKTVAVAGGNLITHRLRG